MAQKDRLGVTDAETSRSRRRSKSRSPSRKKKNGASAAETSPPPPPPYVEKQPVELQAATPTEDPDSGVKDNDIFLLPSSDYSIMILLTIIAAAVRLFRIYQPSSVVFDEVQ
jgi:dolichyl-phosphate-mannose-protein mannosyltransferase